MRFKRFALAFVSLLAGLAINRCLGWHVHAMEFPEVKPYVFAELPHGRIYKTVHEGCELYIVETDTNAYNYSITTGRGCK